MKLNPDYYSSRIKDVTPFKQIGDRWMVIGHGDSVVLLYAFKSNSIHAVNIDDWDRQPVPPFLKNDRS